MITFAGGYPFYEKTSTVRPGGVFERKQSDGVNGVDGAFILSLGSGTADTYIRGLMQHDSATSMRTMLAAARSYVGTTGTLVDNHSTSYANMMMTEFNPGVTTKVAGKFNTRFTATFTKAGF